MEPANTKTFYFESLEHLFRALLVESGDGMFFTFEDLIITAANDCCCDLYGVSKSDLIGRDLRTMFAESSRHVIEQAMDSIADYANWIGEVTGVRESGEPFPVDLTVNRLPLDNCCLISFAIHDLTEYKRLKTLLLEEKSHRREMYITMRNLMKAFEKEKSGIESMISHRIETLFLPAIERLKKESSPDIRKMYLDILRAQLLDLTKEFSQSSDGRFLSLTATELKICKLIRQGFSSKEIAGELQVAFETIQAHRRNIRKKLKIQGKKVNLFAVLSSTSFFPK